MHFIIYPVALIFASFFINKLTFTITHSIFFETCISCTYFILLYDIAFCILTSLLFISVSHEELSLNLTVIVESTFIVYIFEINILYVIRYFDIL